MNMTATVQTWSEAMDAGVLRETGNKDYSKEHDDAIKIFLKK